MYGVRGILLVSILAVAVLIWKWQDIQRLMTVNSLFAEDRIVENFSHMDRAFFHETIPLDDTLPSELPANPRQLPDLADWVDDRRLTALVVLKDGELVHEAYFQDTTEEDLRISWSVAKSFLSALLGMLIEDGVVSGVDALVTDYVPELADTAYDGATIRDALQMASGVRFNEDYFDRRSDINRMGRVLALGGTLDGFTMDIQERAYAPGESFQYVSIDTHVIGMVIRGATGRSVTELMGERLLSPLGLESANPYYITDGDGVAFVLGGLNMMTRDYARFGQLYLQEGRWQGEQLVPAAWVAESTAPSSPTAEGAIQYGYQWWVPADAREGEFLARGVYGQFVYINRPAGVVVAVNSGDRGFREPGSFEQNLTMFRLIADAL